MHSKFSCFWFILCISIIYLGFATSVIQFHDLKVLFRWLQRDWWGNIYFAWSVMQQVLTVADGKGNISLALVRLLKFSLSFSASVAFGMSVLACGKVHHACCHPASQSPVVLSLCAVFYILYSNQTIAQIIECTDSIFFCFSCITENKDTVVDIPVDVFSCNLPHFCLCIIHFRL